MKVSDLMKQRGVAFDAFKALAEKPVLTTEENAEYETRKTEVKNFDAQIDRAREAQDLAARDATPVGGQEGPARVPAKPESDPYISRDAAIAAGLGTNKGLVVGGMLRMVGRAQIGHQDPVAAATAQYGESHPVVAAVRALVVGTGDSGGFIVPPDYQAEIIELLRPMAVVRGSNPRTMPMPRGTMRLPGQASAASAGYGPEGAKIAASQQKLRSIVATFKKLTALVPVSNDMMRFASPAVDAFVRDDLVRVMSLSEDKAFLLGDGTADTPMGWLGFANLWVSQNAGTVGVWNTGANSTFAVNGADPANSTGGNFLTSTQVFTLGTVAVELGGAVNRLDQANVPDTRRVWYMNPRAYNFLLNVQNSLGVYVYRDELSKGALLGYPVKKTTQIGNNYFNTDGTHTDCSFVFLAEMDEAIILDSMQLELAVSREGSYIDSGGTTVSAFQNDQTIIRAIAEHDFQVRHDQSVAVIQGVRWAPQIS